MDYVLNGRGNFSLSSAFLSLYSCGVKSLNFVENFL
jgi:hypothetical protein